MTDNGRLIINARGETVQVLPATRPHGAHAVTLQLGVLADAVTTLPNGMLCVELLLAVDEANGLSLKLADGTGMIAEPRPRDRKHG